MAVIATGEPIVPPVVSTVAEVAVACVLIAVSPAGSAINLSNSRQPRVSLTAIFIFSLLF